MALSSFSKVKNHVTEGSLPAWFSVLLIYHSSHSPRDSQPRRAERYNLSRTGDPILGRTPRAWSPFPHLKLSGRQVDISNHFCAGVFHLQTGIQLQEVEAAILAVEIFNCPCTHVAHGLGQEDSTLQRNREQGVPSGFLG